ncbi:hypothetical protein CK203_021317 [Vitis vinifera]|uniref:DUF4283 domain-containing protein n=1 Tax=Vitis vinifera TaxID=29760 RepID=A0A438IM64_VITVI|nr:hypothetical protein CK203_021317 [Vitis vinifera]
MWLKDEGFKDLIGGWWQGIVVRGSPSYRLVVKLKGLKQNLKIWNKEVFGRLERNKAEALQAGGALGFSGRREKLNRRGIKPQKEAKEDYAKVRLTEEQEVREGIADAYQQLLSESSGWKADIGGLVLKQISHSEAEALELPFSKVEIHAALMGMNGDKASVRTVSLWPLAKLLGDCYAKDGIWAKMVGMDVELHIHCQVLSVGERCASWVFSSSKGYVKGTLFPPTCFMGMEVLSVLITRAVEGGFISAASGLKINLDKSEVIPVGEVEGVNEMAVEIGCHFRVGWGGGEGEEEACPLETPIYSKGGRITLIKSKWIWRFARAKEDLWKKCLRQSMGKRTLDGGQGRQMGCLE